MMKRSWAILGASLSLALLIWQPAPAIAQEEVAPAQPAQPEQTPPAAEGENDFGFDDSGKPIEISAENGIEWRKDERLYIARGNALAVQGDSSVKGDILTAYFGLDDKIARWVAEGHVEVKNGTSTSYGDIANYDATTKVLVLTGKALKTVTEKETVTARDQLEFWREQDAVVAKGDVVIVQSETTIHADEATAYFRREADGKKKMYQMEATGKVRIDKRKQTAFSDKLVYQPNTEIAVLTGNVVMYDGENRYEGGKAELDLKNDVSRLLANGTNDGRVHTVIKPKNQDAETAPATSP
jgi:lipopolysaccharide export system protein LptA